MPKIPEVIGKYKILSCLGSGGTSIVYTATHPTLKRKVVIKKLNLRGNRKHYERFRQEAALMMDLNHDNIVRVFDHFKEGSRHYIVMEFVEGCSLDQILKKGGALPPGAGRYVLSCCCRAIEYIHSRNIIHRDIKPSNIFISSEGDVKLGDFGIAQLESENENSGEFSPIGTPSYMAPEQFLPRAGITKRTDVYALGVSLYEILTSEKLFDGSSLDELKRKILKAKHASLYPLIKDKGFTLYWIVRKSIFRHPGLRFSGVQGVLRFLKLTAPRFRNNDARAVLKVLVEAVAGKKKGTGSKKKAVPVSPSAIKRKWHILPLFSVLILLGAAGFTLSHYPGGYFRLFSRESRGVFQLHIFSEDDSFLHSGDLHIYRDRSSYLEPVKEVDLARNYDFSDKYYLKTGNYRIMVRWGSQVQWILFYLPPMARQEEDAVLEIQSPRIPRKDLNIRSSVSDALTGESLSDLSAVSAQEEDGRWSSVDELSLLSGDAYSFKVSCPGYYPRYMNIPLQFYQDELDLQVQLIPLPGILSIRHDLEELTVLVNGEKKITGGGAEKELLQFGSVPAGSHEWPLSPGVYNIKWISGDAVLEEKIYVKSSGQYGYTIQHIGDDLQAESY